MQSNNYRKKKLNAVSLLYKIVGYIALALSAVIFIVGCIGNPNNSAQGWFWTFVALGVWLSCLTLSEIIQILHDIRAKLYEDKKR